MKSGRGSVKVSLLTLGCKVNQAETARMEGTLKSNGFQVVGLHESPDLSIINTCAVTAKSDYQSRQLIRRAQRAGSRVVVTGCYSELNRDPVKAMPGVEEVVSNKDKCKFIEGLVAGGGRASCDIRPAEGLVGAYRTRAFIKVQDGCDSSCSYCIIPLARGGSRSRPIDEAVGEVKEAAGAGCKETVLTGIHLGTYGHDLSPACTLSDLIEAALGLTEVNRLRLSSIEVTEIDERLLSFFEDRRLCRHLHIPLQSGDDGILRLMGRPYDSGYYSERIRHISDRFPDISIGADVIAGFPGEGEKEFRATFKLIETLPFSYIHVFPYSRREGTRASGMSGEPTPEEKRRRAGALRGLSVRKRQAYQQRFLGQTLEVLIEDGFNDGSALGTAGNYLKVRVNGCDRLRGNIVPVRIAGEAEGGLFGVPIDCS